MCDLEDILYRVLYIDQMKADEYRELKKDVRDYLAKLEGEETVELQSKCRGDK